MHVQIQIATQIASREPTAIFDDGSLRYHLGLPHATVARARSDGSLRYAKVGHRNFHLGAWVSAWLEKNPHLRAFRVNQKDGWFELLRPVLLDPAATYDDETLRRDLLHITSAALLKARRSGLLSYTEVGNGPLYSGRSILDWLEATSRMVPAKAGDQ